MNKKLIALLTVISSSVFVLTACHSKQGEQSVVKIPSNIPSIIQSYEGKISESESLFDKMNQKVLLQNEKEEADTEITQDAIVVENENALKRLPPLMEFGLSLKGAQEGMPIDFIGHTWSLFPGFSLDNQLSSFALIGGIDFDGANNESKEETFSEIKEVINAMSKEYGAPIFEEYTSIKSLDDFKGHNYLKLFEAETFYIAHFATYDEENSSISNIILYISKEYKQYVKEDIYSLIESVEKSIASKGLSLNIKKESIVANGDVVEFGSIKPIDAGSTNKISISDYVDSVIEAPISDDNKNTFLMLKPTSKGQNETKIEENKEQKLKITN